MPTPVTAKNFSSRSRKRQSEFRKRQLIDATIDCIDALGLSQTTLARIAERAGLSQGNVVYHFQSMDALLEQVLAQLSSEYMSNWRNALEAAGDDPREGLRALIKASFAPQICNRKKIGVWFAFWGESRSRPKYMRLCGANDEAFSSRLLELCERLGSRQQARLPAATAALGIEGMIDGLWQNFLIGPPGFKREQAIAAVFELLDAIYPGDRSEISKM
ncbi:MAG: transcriptional regulator BetI [Gammaproteobacteria bacterium]